MLTLRPAVPDDAPLILQFIHELAEYEREPEAVLASEADLVRDGFGDHPAFNILIAEWAGAPAGFALYFYSYSTWEGRRGIYLEDLYVKPAQRGKGIGRAMLTRLAAIAVEEGCARFEWSVLDWNQPAIDFYHATGAVIKSEWRGMRLDGKALRDLAGQDMTEVAVKKMAL